MGRALAKDGSQAGCRAEPPQQNSVIGIGARIAQPLRYTFHLSLWGQWAVSAQC